MGLNVTTPLLTALALANACLIARGASRRTQLGVGAGLLALSGLLFKDWVEGLVYLLLMPWPQAPRAASAFLKSASPNP